MIAHTLMHPLENVPADAIQQNTRRDENGRITHRLLLFNGGHLCWMTAEEIDQAKAAALAWQWEAAEEEVLSGRALLWLRMAVASHNPPGLKECWRCSDWRPDSPREIPCPKCGADDIPF